VVRRVVANEELYHLLPPLLSRRRGSRISIILWGLAEGVIEEDGSPSLLGSDGQGPHAQRDGGWRGSRAGRDRR